MRIGILSDIHANAPALKAVLRAAKKRNVSKLLCCGDFIGYYYDPSLVIDLLDEWDWIGVSGNHEAMLLDWLSNKNRKKIQKKYGSGIHLASKKLSKRNVQRLIKMSSFIKLRIENYRILLCHGSPWDRDFYVYANSKKKIIDKMFNYDPDFDILFFGHTHYTFYLNKDNKQLINPGSVGQPRDRKPGASWVIWDTKLNDVKFLREKYDNSQVVNMCRKYDPELKYLEEVLKRK